LPRIPLLIGLFRSSFEFNQTIRANNAVWGWEASGDAAWVLGELGIPCMALGFAAGMTGQKMVEMLERKGVETDFVRVDGETRVKGWSFRGGRGQSTLASSSLEVSEVHGCRCAVSIWGRWIVLHQGCRRDSRVWGAVCRMSWIPGFTRMVAEARGEGFGGVRRLLWDVIARGLAAGPQ